MRKRTEYIWHAYLEADVVEPLSKNRSPGRDSYNLIKSLVGFNYPIEQGSDARLLNFITNVS
jgi:hypothetical protein